jgi:hypothetical protein
MRSSVMCMDQVSKLRIKSHFEVIEKYLFGAELLHSSGDFNVTWHKCSPLWGLLRTQSRFLLAKSRPYRRVKVCERGPFSHHLLVNCNRNDISWLQVYFWLIFARSRSLEMIKYPYIFRLLPRAYLLYATSLSKVFVTVVYCDNVALVT